MIKIGKQKEPGITWYHTVSSGSSKFIIVHIKEKRRRNKPLDSVKVTYSGVKLKEGKRNRKYQHGFLYIFPIEPKQ